MPPALVTDGFDIEASYQFDLQDYDVPGQFTLRSLASHVSKYIFDTGIPGTQRNVELAGYLANGGSGQTYTQSGGTVMTWKLEETQSYQNDVWGFNLTERWYAGGVSSNKNTIVCAPGTCPVDTVQTPTINFNKVDAVLYLDVGAQLERQRQDPALCQDRQRHQHPAAGCRGSDRRKLDL